VTASAKALDHVKAFVESQNIKSACRNSHLVQGKGDVSFHFLTREILKIKDFLYIAGLHKKLLSIGSLIDKGLIAIFNVIECLMFNNQGIVVARGVGKRIGLYKLETTILANET
jgi:hypothetical protein